MSIVLTMLGARQNAQAPAVVQFFSIPPEAVALQLVVARRRLEGDDLAQALRGALGESDLVSVPTSVAAVVDDVSPSGEIRYYGLAVRLSDGSARAGRVSVGNLAEPPARSISYSALGGRDLPARAASEPSASISGVYRIPTAPAAPAPAYVAPVVDPMEARRLAQQRAQQAALAASGGDPWGSAAVAAAPEEVAPPSEFPIGEFGLRMQGAIQSWDGLRIEWEAERDDAAAYEVFVADRALIPSEVGELLRGETIEGAFVRAIPASVRAVIDNRTPRETRGFYAVVSRTAEGFRRLVGCSARSVDDGAAKVAPFLDPSELDEVRGLAKGYLREARVQLMIFREEAEMGAWKEGLRLCEDALAVYPEYPEALAAAAEIRAARG